MEEMLKKADNPDQYAEEMQFWRDLRSDFADQHNDDSNSSAANSDNDANSIIPLPTAEDSDKT